MNLDNLIVVSDGNTGTACGTLPQEVVVFADTHMKVWTIYTNWLTWFFGANVLAISWIVTAPTLRSEFVKPLIIVLELAMTSGIFATIVLYFYSRGLRRRAVVLLGESSIKDGTIGGLFATSFTNYGCGGLIFIYLSAAIMWLYVYLRL
jgi:hypothetical protein